MNPSQHLALLTRQLLQCIASHQLLQFKGSMLALAVLSLDMEKILPDWLGLTIKLLQTAQVGYTFLGLPVISSIIVLSEPFSDNLSRT